MAVRCSGLVMVLGACDFSVALSVTDAAPPIDTPDAPPQEMRVRDGLCALWAFDESAGAFAFDTSPNPAVALEIMNAPGNNVFPATFENGELVANMPGRVTSTQMTRLGDCEDMGGITLEAWVRSSSATQGTTAEPAFIAGLTFNAAERNIALLQSATQWLGLVRTANANGAPGIVSTAPVNASNMTHLALVADATQRTLYVDNSPVSAGTPAAPTGWDPNYAMVLFDEFNHGRQWTGRIALLAIFKRALTPAEVEKHWVLGPTAN